MCAIEEARARGGGFTPAAGIVHRDIKPDNIILEAEGSAQTDRSSASCACRGSRIFRPRICPGTLAYMAPEMFADEKGNEQTDIYALGVTMFRAFTGEFPYGNLDAVSPSRKSRPTPLGELRPDLPAWLQEVLGRTIALDPAQRFRDVTEFAVEMEAGPARASIGVRRPQTLYERQPVRFWQGVAAILALAVMFLLWRQH